MRKVLLVAAVVFSFASPSFAAKQTVLSGTGVTWGVEVGKINSNFTELYNRAIGDCTVWPCYDGTSDGGTNLKFYGAGGFYQELKAGNSVANRSWTLPIEAPPASGTRILYVDSTGKWHADLDPDTLGGGTGTGLPDGTEANQLIMWDGDSWELTSTLGLIDDTATNGDINKIWSADKVYDLLALKAPLDAPVFTTSVAIPSGGAPVVDSAGKIAVDTTSNQLVYYGTAKRTLTPRVQADFVVKNPVNTDDFLLFKAQHAILITGINVIAQGGTSISVEVQECDSAGINCVTVDGAITADQDGATDDGSISNQAIDANDWVKIVLGAPSGTVNFVTGSIYYMESAD